MTGSDSPKRDTPSEQGKLEPAVSAASVAVGHAPRVLISGATGLIGSAAASALQKDGWQVVRLVRSQSSRSTLPTVAWDPVNKQSDLNAFSGFDAVIHLAGESIVGRWTKRKKAAIRESRVDSTRFLAECLASVEAPPSTFLCASAIGIYGDTEGTLVNEETNSGHGFLSDLGRDWEQAAASAAAHGIRTVSLRIGIVLSPRGGALAQMLLPFKLGLGGPLGPGNQYMSWITVDDVVQVIRRALEDEKLKGPINLVTPNPVTNLEFTKTLAHVLRRPSFLRVPAFALRAIFGELADETLLSSIRVDPAVLRQTGFDFLHPDLEPASGRCFRLPAESKAAGQRTGRLRRV